MIKFQNVHKTYKNRNSGMEAVEALRGVSFLVDEGEFVFVIGKSGSGKSTILKCMNCEERPDAGAIFIDGYNITDMPRALVPVLRRHIGMIFQDFRLIETKTVSENISFAGEIIGLSRKSLHQKVNLVLNIVGLKDKADAYPQQLSGGEQQRVAIARAMLNNPKIIIADEPTGNLDPETSENIMGLLLDINRSGTTVIVCTHDANLVDKMKKRVIEIEEGLVVRDKEDSAYADESAQTVTESLDVAFGEDPGKHADFGEEAYPLIPPVGDFYFGDTPPASQVTRVEPVSAVVPFSGGDDDGCDDAEFAFEEEITDISDLLIENESEQETTDEPALENEVSSTTGSVEPAVNAGNVEVSETSIEPEDIPELPVIPEIPFVSETSVAAESLGFPEPPVHVAPVQASQVQESPRENTGDIDLDIQEDDE